MRLYLIILYFSTYSWWQLGLTSIIYNLLLFLLTPVWLPLAIRRNLRRGRPALGGGLTPGDRQALAEKRVIWLHCVSMGESAAGAVLYRHLASRLPGIAWVFTVTTPTGRSILQHLLGEAGLLRYFPLDLPWSVRRFLRDAHPELLILVETELWPNLIRAAHRRGTRVAVVNGRVSDRSARRYDLAGWLLRPVLAGVDLFLMQTPLDAARIVRAGAPAGRVEVTGNIKLDLETPAAAIPSLAELGLGEAPVLVAGSTHRGEEEILLQAVRTMRAVKPVSLVIVPRHLERLPEIEALSAKSGLSWGRIGEPAAVPRDVLLVNTYGEMLRFYSLADVVFVGGSLVPIGGHNPAEASALGRPVVFGPHMENFRELAGELLAADAALTVRTAGELAETVGALVRDRDRALCMGERGRSVVERNRGAAERSAVRLAALVGAD